MDLNDVLDDEAKYFDRIGVKRDLSEISKMICKDFDLGSFFKNSIITTGYEDFNYILESQKGKFVVKILFSDRTDEEAQRYREAIVKAVETGVNHPKLHSASQGFLHQLQIDDVNLRLFVFDYIDGKDFFSAKSTPSMGEIKVIAQQTALIHQIDYKPEFIYDSWAIVNFEKELKKKGQCVEPSDIEIIKKVKDEFIKLDLEKLPHAFVHGDIIATNLMRDSKGKLWVIDFAVSNYLPRIIDLAVIACNLCFDEDSAENSSKNFALLVSEYEKYIKLTKEEREALPLFIKAAHAMHILCASYEKVENNNNSKENEYWINQGKKGIRQEVY